MLTWLLVYGVGGCWSGYTNATVIRSPDRDMAMKMASIFVWKDTAEERGYSRGCSFDVEQIVGDVRDCALYASRCKPEAKLLADLAFDALEVAHG